MFTRAKFPNTAVCWYWPSSENWVLLYWLGRQNGRGIIKIKKKKEFEGISGCASLRHF